VLELKKSQVEEIILRIKSKAESDEKVLGVIIYGSFLNEDNFQDVDIALAFEPFLEKSEIYSKRIEYSGEFHDVFDFQALNLLPLAVQKEVLAGRVVYETRQLYDIAYNIIREYEDFEKYRIQYIEGVMIED
jgi:predicted nucleotidyltransferase